MAANQHDSGSDLYSYNTFTGNPSTKRSNNFLWWCSGAYQSILQKYPSEHTRFSGLGAVLLATFLLAALSAGYAFYTIFDNAFLSVIFALIWGAIIFNFDRFLVSTMRKYGVPIRNQLYIAIPRIVLAILVGVTIARPLELKLFDKEINTRVAANLQDKVTQFDSIARAEKAVEINNALLEKQQLMARKQSITDTLHGLQQAYLAEADGTGGSGARGIESITKLKMEAYNNAQLQFAPESAKIDEQLFMHDSILNRSRLDIAQRKLIYESSLQQNIGFLERNKALTDLTSKESSVYWACLLISLLIIIIEVAPVLSKLIMQSGPYDVALAREELSQMAASENEIRRDKLMFFEKRKRLYEINQTLSKELSEQVSSLQKKHIKIELEDWEKGGTGTTPAKAPLDEVMKQIKSQYNYSEENLL